ncbi:MAG: class I SAM-dependent methyltransferase, partial [Dehalococcoidia bacterium]
DLAGPPDGLALDVGTGGGATAHALARAGWSVLPLDLTVPMLQAARQALREQTPQRLRGVVQGDAEALPLREGSVALVTARNTAHHFPQPLRFLEQAARVLRPGGRLLIVDLVGHERPDFDAHLQAWERRRDPSHAASIPISRWQSLFREAGLVPLETHHHRYRHDFAPWTERQRMPAAARDALARDMREAPQPIRDYFEIRVDADSVASFTTDVAIMLAVRP